MRLASLSLLVAGMLACSGSTDNPEESGGRGGSGGSSGRGGAAGKGGAGGRGGAGAGTGGSGGEAGGSAGTGGAGGEAGADAGAGGVDPGYCGAQTGTLTTGSGTPSVALVPLSTTDVDGSECNAVERAFPLASATHTDACVEIEYGTNPPSSGAHYGIWPVYKEYAAPVPRGFLVHGMEHGAVVIGYSCDDCDAEVAEARALVAALGPDPLCCADPSCAGATTRVILAPDPRLETRWAAASWGFTLVADCFEADVFRAFVEAHRGRGPEAVCSDGVDVGND